MIIDIKNETASQLKDGTDKQYFAEAKNWELSMEEMKDKSVKNSTMFAIVGCVVGVLGMLSATVQALKDPPMPALLKVNESNGMVEVVNRITDGKTTYEDALNKAFAQKYVRYREAYSRSTAEEYYKAVGLLSGASEQKSYSDWFSPKNKNSPLNLYGDTARVKVRMKSTSFIKPTVALVRYLRCEERAGDASKVSHWAATVTFRYSAAPMSEKDREVNPLGFEVMEYNTDPDSVTDTDGGDHPCDDRKSNTK